MVMSVIFALVYCGPPNRVTGCAVVLIVTDYLYQMVTTVL